MFYNYSNLEVYGKQSTIVDCIRPSLIFLSCFCKSAIGFSCAKTLSRAVVESTVRIPVRFQGLSPRFQTVCCIPYSTITPVLRCVLSVVRAVYYEIALSYKSYIASGLPFSYNSVLISSGKPQSK